MVPSIVGYVTGVCATYLLTIITFITSITTYGETLKRITRTLLAGTASASLIALAGCAGMGGPSVEDAPKLSEIDDLLWETMQAEDSVTLSTDMENLLGDDEALGEMFGEDSSLNIYGALDGSATAVSVGDSDLIRAFGQDSAYLSGEGMFAMFGGEGMGLDETQQEQLDAMSAEFADTWIDFSSQMNGSEDEFNIGSLLDNIQEGWTGGDDSEDTPVDRDEISDEGAHEVRDDVDVWVYSGEEEGQELVLFADHEAPKFYELSDDDQTMRFSDWGSTESPEQPAEENIISEEDAQERMMAALLGGMGS